MTTSALAGAAVGAAGAVAARHVLTTAVRAKLARDLARLNAGDYRPLLSGYAEDAVLHFNDGDHRWAGDHRGRDAIERFLRDFVGAGLTGEIKALWVAGPPWALRMAVRFDDEARGPDGRLLYANRTTLVVHSRWGRIVEQWDFYEDTARILAFEEELRRLGRPPAAREAAPPAGAVA